MGNDHVPRPGAHDKHHHAKVEKHHEEPAMPILHPVPKDGTKKDQFVKAALPVKVPVPVPVIVTTAAIVPEEPAHPVFTFEKPKKPAVPAPAPTPAPAPAHKPHAHESKKKDEYVNLDAYAPNINHHSPAKAGHHEKKHPEAKHEKHHDVGDGGKGKGAHEANHGGKGHHGKK